MANYSLKINPDWVVFKIIVCILGCKGKSMYFCPKPRHETYNQPNQDRKI